MNRILFCLLFSTLFFACNTSDDVQSPPQTSANFYALTVGNTWVYKNYKYNINTQVYDDTGVIDSVSIVATETVLGNTFYKFRTLTTGNENQVSFCNPNGEHFELLREENGYLLRDNGTVKFVHTSFEPILVDSDSSFEYYLKLNETTTTMQTPAGNFDCASMNYYVLNEDEEQLPGTNNYLYADGIGMVYDTTSFVSQSIHSIERRLVSYQVF